MPELEVGLGIISIGLATHYQPAAPVQRTSGRSIRYPTPIGTKNIYLRQLVELKANHQIIVIPIPKAPHIL